MSAIDINAPTILSFFIFLKIELSQLNVSKTCLIITKQRFDDSISFAKTGFVEYKKHF